MTCKDCIHYNVCAEEGIYFTDKYIKGATISNDVRTLCHWFKNKADFVEVVRCRDCRYFTAGMAVGMCKRVEDKPIIPCGFNHFCSYGERRDT